MPSSRLTRFATSHFSEQVLTNSRYFCRLSKKRKLRCGSGPPAPPCEPVAPRIAMIFLSPSPAFEATVKAQGGHGERVEKASELPAALIRARDVVLKEKRQALLNVICPP